MARYLKRGMDAGAIKAADAQVRQTVEPILAEVEARRDGAVRALSEKFDKWSPTSFKLTDGEVERAIGQVAKRDLDDIRFAQAQVRNFAQKQKETMLDSRSRRCPASSWATSISPSARGLLRPRRALSHGRLRAHDERSPPRWQACERIIGAAPPRGPQGRAYPADRRGHETRRADEIYVLGGVQALAAMAYGCVGSPAVDMITGRATPTSPRPSGSSSAVSASTCWPARPRSSSSPTTPPIRHWSPPTCWARPSTARTARPCS